MNWFATHLDWTRSKHLHVALKLVLPGAEDWAGDLQRSLPKLLCGSSCCRYKVFKLTDTHEFIGRKFGSFFGGVPMLHCAPGEGSWSLLEPEDVYLVSVLHTAR